MLVRNAKASTVRVGKKAMQKINIVGIYNDCVETTSDLSCYTKTIREVFLNYTFADGTPFGVKVME